MNRIVILVCFLLACGYTCGQRNPTVPVQTRLNAKDSVWTTHEAQTVKGLPGYKPKKEPALSRYGGYMVNRQQSTGFFRTEKLDGRWWIIDPEGYPFHHRAVVAFSPGTSARQKQAFAEKFGSNAVWVEKETEMLRSYGFNGAGAWSAAEDMHRMDNPLVYTAIIYPMGNYRREHQKAFGGKYRVAGWQGYRFDLPMVFDPRFDEYVEEAVQPLARFKDDPNLLGYFTDNELPWVNDALDRHLTLLAKDEAGYIAAKQWLDQRKGRDASPTDITEEDRMEFTAFFFDTYMRKVTAALRKVDPNHMYLGCRFNQEKNQELTNPYIFRIAGQYMDIISINHYRRWQPDQELMNQWGEWSGKPFLITEWYVKGEDSGLPNETGAGWNVHTQNDRGLFYENFCIELLKNPHSVGWHWFRYQDNDPEDLTTDPSNRDSNKGVVNSEYTPWTDALKRMREVNVQTYRLIQHFDSQLIQHFDK
ncbi:hypothetical protein [Bacteroides sp. 51]|uniref:hypothetical protein n=1 Tax=Bacteroides sp. 51 TaxID=2302938 RepID=UPI0013D60F3F|nr:hypothetical protein [Bacteroides sp. 51]NDV80476.1 hypothetical protein [Bacteroides sp. 51]